MSVIFVPIAIIFMFLLYNIKKLITSNDEIGLDEDDLKRIELKKLFIENKTKFIIYLLMRYTCIKKYDKSENLTVKSVVSNSDIVEDVKKYMCFDLSRPFNIYTRSIGIYYPDDNMKIYNVKIYLNVHICQIGIDFIPKLEHELDIIKNMKKKLKKMREENNNLEFKLLLIVDEIVPEYIKEIFKNNYIDIINIREILDQYLYDVNYYYFKVDDVNYLK